MGMARSGSLKVVKAVAANDDSFMSSLKDLEAMEHQRLARLAREEEERAERARAARNAEEQAEQKLRAERARADADARAAEQLLALREREAAAVVAARSTAIVEVEKIGAEARVRLDEIALKRKHEIEIETLRLSSKSAAAKRSIVSAFAGALVVLVASVGVQVGVLAPAASDRLSRAIAALDERDHEIQALRGDVATQATHAKALESSVRDVQTKLDDANKKLADLASKPTPKPATHVAGGAVQAHGASVDYGMPLCPPGVTWDPMCIPNPKK